MAEPLNATFYAFQKRERGGVLTSASIAFAIIGVAVFAAFIALFWGPVLGLVSWYGEIINASLAQDEAAMAQAGFPAGIFAVIPAIFLLMFVFYLLYAAYEAACLRWLIHGEQKGFMGLTLDADTWRVYVTYWVWFGLYLAGSTALSIIMIAVMSILALGGAGAGADAAGMAMGFIAVTGLLYIAYYGAMIYFAVRFAPAAATSIARRRFSFFQAWTVTKGRFWALLGAFLLLWLIYCIFAVVFGAIGLGAVLGAAAPQWGDLFSTDPHVMTQASDEFGRAIMAALAQPQMWALLGGVQLVIWGVGLVLYVAMFGINARAAALALAEGKIKPAV